MKVLKAFAVGDGTYPVYACNNEEGRPRFAIVVMDDTPIEDIVK